MKYDKQNYVRWVAGAGSDGIDGGGCCGGGVDSCCRPLLPPVVTR